MKVRFECEDCDNTFESNSNKFSAWIRCPKCMGKAYELEFSKQGTFKQIPGYSSEGYNTGLGEVVRNKTHYNELLKKHNVKAVG